MIQVFLLALGVYLALGILFAVYFVSRGVARMDPVAKAVPLGFRLLIFPGSVALWPLLARNLLYRGDPR